MLEVDSLWSEMTLNYRVMVEGYPNLKEEVGGSNPDCEISSLLDVKLARVMNNLLCFDAGMSAFCLKKEEDFISANYVEWRSVATSVRLCNQHARYLL